MSKIENRKYKCRLRNKIIKHIFLEYRLFAQQQQDFWKKEAEKHGKKEEGVWILNVSSKKEEAKKTQKEKRGSLNIECIVIER